MKHTDRTVREMLKMLQIERSGTRKRESKSERVRTIWLAVHWLPVGQRLIVLLVISCRCVCVCAGRNLGSSGVVVKAQFGLANGQCWLCVRERG